MADPGLYSKFVEMQQEEARRGPQVTGRRTDAAIQERRESLRLSLARIENSLSTTKHPLRRKQLKAALESVMQEMAALG